MSANITTSGHLHGIHALRGFAALIVMLFHLHYVGHIPLPRSWGFIASRGGLGVELFFVLSAFSLFHSNLKSIRSRGSDWVLGYLTKRFFRIAPLFYVMLVVHCLFILYIFNAKLDLRRVVMSLLFIFNFAPKEAEGIVWASWTIGVEMVFYALLPIAIVSIRSLKSAVAFWVIAALGSYVFRQVIESDNTLPAGYAHYAFFSQVGVFGAGILAYWAFVELSSLTTPLRTGRWWLAVILGPTIAALLLSDLSNWLVRPGRPDTQLWGLSFGLIAVLTTITPSHWFSHRVLQYFGERSYSIYLTHPLIIFSLAPLIRPVYDFYYPVVGGYGFALCAAISLGTTLVISEATYRFIEMPGIALGRKLAYASFSPR